MPTRTKSTRRSLGAVVAAAAVAAVVAVAVGEAAVAVVGVGAAVRRGDVAAGAKAPSDIELGLTALYMVGPS